MSVDPKAAHGTELKIGDGGGTEVFTAIPAITSGPTGPNPNTTIASAITHDSDSPVKRATTIDYQQVTFGILYDSADTIHQQLVTDLQGKTVRNFKEVFTDTGAEIWSFAGIISSINFNNDPGGFVTADVTIEVTSAAIQS